MKNKRTRKFILSLPMTTAALVLCGSNPALARGSVGLETAHYQELGLGIAHPSLQNATRENPAVLAETSSTKVVIQNLSFSTAAITPSNAEGHILLGNGDVGGSIGYVTGLPNGNSEIRGGLAFESSAFSAGFACNLSISGGVGANCSNFGLILNPRGSFRVGGQVLTGSTPQFGGGIAMDLSSSVTFATDATYLDGLLTFKPAIGFQTSSVFGQFGYGVTSGSYNTVSVNSLYLSSSGFSAGIGFHLGRGSSIYASYSLVSPLYAGLTLQL